MVFASANAVDDFFDAARALLNLDARAFAGTKVGAVGAADGAARLAARSIRADLVPERATAAEELARASEPGAAGSCSRGSRTGRAA